MDAQLETIGARCHYCSRQDFLPFKCAECTHSFCLSHSTPSNHACPVHHQSPSPSTLGPTAATRKSESGMSLKALQAEHLVRRKPMINTRTLAPPLVLSSKSQDALSALKSLGSSFQLRGKSSTVVKSHVELGKLKAQAKGDVKTPLERRVWVYLKYQDRVLPFFIDQQWSVGRTLDAVAIKMGLVNENARTTDEGRRLHLLCNGIVLEPSQVVGKLVKNGDTVLIFRGVRPVDV